MSSIEDRRDILADELIRKGAILTAPVEAAFRSVPRHHFIPEVDPDLAYRDEVVPIEASRGEEEVESSASQPAIVAWVLEQLEIGTGERVLEVGSGTGYNAALMAHLVGEEGQVVTVEIDEALARPARQGLAAVLGKVEKGFGDIEVIHADGSLGHPERSPYDRIVVTAAAPDIAPAWREQLAREGRLAMPLELWPGLQVRAAFEPAEDYLGREHLVSVAGSWCGFLPLGGELADPENMGCEGSREDWLCWLWDRARSETGAAERTLYEKAGRFDREGMIALFSKDQVRGPTLDPEIRHLIVD